MVGERVLKLWLFGGNSNNGANCGLAYANSNNAWSNSNSNISARHTFNGRETIRVSLVRHAKAPEYPEPRQQSRMYRLCGRNNIHLAREASVRPSVVLVNSFGKVESSTQSRSKRR